MRSLHNPNVHTEGISNRSIFHIDHWRQFLYKYSRFYNIYIYRSGENRLEIESIAINSSPGGGFISSPDRKFDFTVLISIISLVFQQLRHFFIVSIFIPFIITHQQVWYTLVGKKIFLHKIWIKKSYYSFWLEKTKNKNTI